MEDIFASIVVVLLSAAVFALVAKRYRSLELQLLAFSLLSHAIAAVAQVVITRQLYGSGDIFGYTRRGEEFGAALRMDFQPMAWELLKLLFHQDAYLPITISGIGSSTGSMSAIAGFINFFTGGEVYTSCMLLGMLTFFGQLAAYEVFREIAEPELHPRLLFANMLMPSVVFWSSGLLKEAVAIVGLGPLFLGVYRTLKGRLIAGMPLIVFGAITIALVKAYILFAFVAAAGAWVYAARASDAGGLRLRPLHLALGMGLALGAILALGALFPQYSLSTISDQAAQQQEQSQQAIGGSSYVLMAPEDASPLVQLLYSPLALITSLYRPFLFEIGNALMFVNALETTALLGLTINIFFKSKLRELWTRLTTSPPIFFALIFVLVLGVAVGLTTSNLGTLSRYRAPLVPMFATLLLYLKGVPARVVVPDAPRIARRIPTPVG